jgi:hypothetical protein
LAVAASKGPFPVQAAVPDAPPDDPQRSLFDP